MKVLRLTHYIRAALKALSGAHNPRGKEIGPGEAVITRQKAYHAFLGPI